MPRYAAKADKNQPVIVRELRGLGYKVQHTHTLGQGAPDILVGGYFVVPNTGGAIPALVWVEIKDEGGKLTEAEEKFHAEWEGYPVIVAYKTEDIIEWFNGRQ